MKRYLAILVVIGLTVFLFGCSGGGGNGSGDDNPVSIVSTTEYPEMTMDELLASMQESGADLLSLSTCLGGFGTVAAGLEETGFSPSDIITLFNLLVHWLKDVGVAPRHIGFAASQVVFQWGDGSDDESGLLVVPRAIYHNQDYPMIVLLHPTQTERSQSPSFNIVDNEMTTIFAKLLATLGYIVVVPDYQGLGVHLGVHPYCLTSLARSATGMIYAADELGVRWDGRIFLMGYSEGGYATVVTAREIEENHPDLNLVAAAALDGPHSLSEAMHDVMLTAGLDYQTPYFLPYVISAYAKQYPDVLQFETAVIDNPQGYNQELYAMLFGDYTGDQISKKMMKSDVAYKGPRSILVEGIQEELEDKTSQLCRTFVENDSFYGWSPADVKILLLHNPYDDSVPVQNSLLAKEAWKSLSNVELKYFVDYLDDQGTIHAGALPYAYFKGTAWIDSLAY